MRLLVSLHDVTPVHQARLSRAEALFESLGVGAVTYLYVPNYHGAGDADADAAFVAWSRAPRPFAVDWWLHGYFHEETPADTGGRRLSAWLASRLLTDREGEFLALQGPSLDARIAAGMLSFYRCFGQPPCGFVPPAWLHNEQLLPALRRFGFEYTEDHTRITHVGSEVSVVSPVITWATRTRVRRVGSRWLAPLMVSAWRHMPTLRLALHPFDFDHPETVASITVTLETLLDERKPERYGPGLFGQLGAVGT